MKVSVILCTYNPNRLSLEDVISSLKIQTLDVNQWELIIIDNNCDSKISEWIDLDWHSNAYIALEKKSGLLFARLKGASLAKGELIVFVDDDNVLDKKYLEKSLIFYTNNKHVGAFGGKSLPIFEVLPPDWLFQTGINLGCQDFGEQNYISNYAADDFILNQYPSFAPIGTGMAIQKVAFLKYAEEVYTSKSRLALGRKGKSLFSGEDNDIILTTIKHRYEIAYLPELVVQHIIPKKRLSFSYLKKMAYESNRSWVHVLHIHQILPWAKITAISLKPRFFLSYFRLKAWKSEKDYIKWCGACGMFKGLTEID